MISDGNQEDILGNYAVIDGNNYFLFLFLPLINDDRWIHWIGRKQRILLETFNQKKTFREIQKIIRKSPRDIKKIIDKADPDKPSSLSQSSQAYRMFKWFNISHPWDIESEARLLQYVTKSVTSTPLTLPSLDTEISEVGPSFASSTLPVTLPLRSPMYSPDIYFKCVEFMSCIHMVPIVYPNPVTFHMTIWPRS